MAWWKGVCVESGTEFVQKVERSLRRKDRTAVLQKVRGFLNRRMATSPVPPSNLTEGMSWLLADKVAIFYTLVSISLLFSRFYL